MQTEVKETSQLLMTQIEKVVIQKEKIAMQKMQTAKMRTEQVLTAHTDRHKKEDLII